MTESGRTPSPEKPSARYLSAYYYDFTPTGVDEVDAILEAVARAGKLAHHTRDWSDDDHYGEGKAPVDLIQRAAQEAADAFTAQMTAPARTQS